MTRELKVLFHGPHNEFIRVYFEFGLIGLAALCYGLSYALTPQRQGLPTKASLVMDGIEPAVIDHSVV